MNEVSFVVFSFYEVSNLNFFALIGAPPDKLLTSHKFENKGKI